MSLHVCKWPACQVEALVVWCWGNCGQVGMFLALLRVEPDGGFQTQSPWCSSYSWSRRDKPTHKIITIVHISLNLEYLAYILHIFKSNSEVLEVSPVLKEAERLPHKSHLHFNRGATLQSVFNWNQRHIWHLFHHQPHLWYVLKGRERATVTSRHFEGENSETIIKDDFIKVSGVKRKVFSPCHPGCLLQTHINPPG